MENEALLFILNYENSVKELYKQSALSNFKATISGEPADYQKAGEFQLKLEKFYSNKKQFEKIFELKKSENIKDPIIKRQIDLIYNSYAGNQFDSTLLEEIIALSTKIEQTFSTYRAEINGKKVTDNQVDEILKKSIDSAELKTAWEASKNIGETVAADVIELVKLRNKAATQLGYDNFHEMSLSLSEQSVEEIDSIFDKLDEYIKVPFAKLKQETDSFLAQHYGVNNKELMPWHYQDKFFQQGPNIYKTNLDKYFEESDISEITKNYYRTIGIDIADLFEKSDLFEKEGKYQHAYCTHIDRDGDVRVVCNIKPNRQWMSTMLHEFGHAAYDKYLSQKLPWTLRQPAHIFTTEAIAIMFGRMAANAEWLKDVMKISDMEKGKINEDCTNSLRMEQIIFSRWVQVVYRFEKELYNNPDQDLNLLWKQLVEKYQLLKMPEGRNKADWAAKIHIALYPAYYHNYMLGELLASQLYYYIKDKVLKADSKSVSFYEKKDAGNYLINLFMSYGSLYRWDKLIETATGEKLNPKYFAEQFVNK